MAKSLQKEWFANSEYYREGLKENSKEYKNLFTLFLSSNDYRLLEETEYRRQLIAFAKDIECRKLNVYIQTDNNVVAILQSPPEKIDNKSNKAEVVKFLGYDWSNRKGDEGIKYLTSHVQEAENSDDEDDKDAEIVQAINSIKYIETPLYNPDNDNDVTKFSYALRKHITEACKRFSFGTTNENCRKPYVGISGGLLQFAQLTDLVDFGRTTFNLAIKSAIEKKIAEKKYRFPTKRLEQLLLHIDGPLTKIGKEEIQPEGEIPVVTQEAGNLIAGYTENTEPIIDLPLIVFGDHSCTFKYVDFKFVRGADGTQLIKVNEEEILPKFLYHYLHTIQIENSDKYERHFKYLKNVQIPLPPFSLQQKIVAKCHQIDAESQKAEDRIGKLQEEIDMILSAVEGDKTTLEQIAPYSTARIAYGKIDPDTYISTDNILQNYKGAVAYEGVPNVDSIIEYHKGDILVSNIRPYLKKIWYADKSGGCSPDVLVFRPKSNCDSRYIYYSMRRQDFFDWAMQDVKGLKMPRGKRDNIIRFSILLPSLDEQKDIVLKIQKIEEEIAALKNIYDGAAARKEAVLRRELIEDDKQGDAIITDKVINISPSIEENQFFEFESLVADDSFMLYKWDGLDQKIRDFFSSSQTILLGCYKGKDYFDWIETHHLYTIRLGKAKGSMETNRKLFDSTKLLVLYELNNPKKLNVYRVDGYQEMNNEKLEALGYPNKKPRKNYLAFSIIPLEMDLSYIMDHHLIEELVQQNTGAAKGTPIFIEP